MKPHVVCHMVTSLDGRLHPSRFTKSPDGTRAEWSALYESIQDELEGDAWLVGRVTMAEMSKAGPHAPATWDAVERPHRFARRDAGCYAIAIDRSGKLHFGGPEVQGAHVVVLLGRDVADAHLAELAADGVSYVVADDDAMSLAPLLETLGRELGIRRLLLEGGATINGAFFAAGLVDEFSVLVAPAIDGRPSSEAIVDAGPEGLAGRVQLSFRSCEPRAHGAVLLRYDVTPG